MPATPGLRERDVACRSTSGLFAAAYVSGRRQLRSTYPIRSRSRASTPFLTTDPYPMFSAWLVRQAAIVMSRSFIRSRERPPETGVNACPNPAPSSSPPR